MNHISSVTLTARVPEAFEERTSKAGKTYFIGGVQFMPERAEEPIFLRAFASTWAFRDVVPSEGDEVLVSGELSPERDGGLGLRINAIQVIGSSEGVEVKGDDESDEIPF